MRRTFLLSAAFLTATSNTSTAATADMDYLDSLVGRTFEITATFEDTAVVLDSSGSGIEAGSDRLFISASWAAQAIFEGEEFNDVNGSYTEYALQVLPNDITSFQVSYAFGDLLYPSFGQPFTEVNDYTSVWGNFEIRSAVSEDNSFNAPTDFGVSGRFSGSDGFVDSSTRGLSLGSPIDDIIGILLRSEGLSFDYRPVAGSFTGAYLDFSSDTYPNYVSTSEVWNDGLGPLTESAVYVTVKIKDVTPIPLPAPILLLMGGVAGLAGLRRARRAA